MFRGLESWQQFIKIVAIFYLNIIVLSQIYYVALGYMFLITYKKLKEGRVGISRQGNQPFIKIVAFSERNTIILSIIFKAYKIFKEVKYKVELKDFQSRAQHSCYTVLQAAGPVPDVRSERGLFGKLYTMPKQWWNKMELEDYLDMRNVPDSFGAHRRQWSPQNYVHLERLPCV